MEIFKELVNLGYKQFTNKTINELDYLPFDNYDRIIEYSFIFKWFRETYKLYPSIILIDKNKWKVILWDADYIETIKEKFITFEDAQVNAINKLIEILKNKKNEPR